jgi:Tol biopolymer transport system component
MIKFSPKTWRNALWLVASALLVVGCLSSGFEPGSGLIVYVGVDENIYTIEPNGQNQQAVTSDAQTVVNERGQFRVYQQPTWSPDRNRIAFIQTAVGDNGTQTAALFTAQPDGSDLLETYRSEAQFPFYLYWSPDSQRLSFLATGGAEPGLVLYMLALGENQAQLLDIGQPFYWDWSPDSQTILIHTGGATRINREARLALLGLNGEVIASELQLQPGFFQAPAWSPDGQEVLLAARSQDQGEGLLLTNSKGEFLRLLQSLDGAFAFSWSPDGQWVACVFEGFLGSEDASRKLYYFDPDRPDETHPAKQNLVIAFFWSPDSRKIAYFVPQIVDPSGQRVSMQTQESQLQLELHVLDLQTGSAQRLIRFTPTGDFLNMLQFFDQYQRSATLWSPDSKNLVISALDQDGEYGIYTVDISGQSEANRLASGRLAFWSWK